MFQDSPKTFAEAQVTDAWNEYAEAAQVARASWSDHTATSAQRCELHGKAVAAHDRFADAYRLLTEPTPPSMEHERNRLACEGVLLISIAAAYIGFVLSDHPQLALWIALPLGGWLYSFGKRLGMHTARRL